MADTLNDVILPANTPVDLYAASGIAVGTKVSVQNVTSGVVRVHVGAVAPTLGVSGAVLLSSGESGENDTGDTGLWAWSVAGGAVQIEEVV